LRAARPNRADAFIDTILGVVLASLPSEHPIMPRTAFTQTRERVPPESVLKQLRIPFVRKVTLVRGPAVEEVVWAARAEAQRATRLDLWKGGKAVEEVAIWSP
jgi:hypothetical protein